MTVTDALPPQIKSHGRLRLLRAVAALAMDKLLGLIPRYRETPARGPKTPAEDGMLILTGSPTRPQWMGAMVPSR